MTHTFDASNAPDEGGADFPKLELKTNESARVNLLGTKGWAVTVRHWVDKVGYVHCHAMTDEMTLTDLLKLEKDGGNPDTCLLCKMSAEGVEAVNSPQRRIAIRVLRYKTDLKGKLTAGALSFWMEIWIVSNQKYKDILNVLREWGGEKRNLIHNHDLLLSCEDEKYQKTTITPMKKALWKEHADDVKAYMKEEMPKYKLSECLGEYIEEEALKRRFARLSRRTQVAEPASTDVDEILEHATEAGSGVDFLGDIEDDKEEATPASADEKTPDVPAATTEKEDEEGDFLSDLLDEKDDD